MPPLFCLIFVDLSVCIGFVCHADNHFILIVCYCELSLLLSLSYLSPMDLKLFPTIYLLLSFQVYQEIVSANDMLF